MVTLDRQRTLEDNTHIPCTFILTLIEVLSNTKNYNIQRRWVSTFVNNKMQTINNINYSRLNRRKQTRNTTNTHVYGTTTLHTRTVYSLVGSCSLFQIALRLQRMVVGMWWWWGWSHIGTDDNLSRLKLT